MTDTKLASLLSFVADRLPGAAQHEGGPCQAVWRDPADRALVACADDAEPGADYCTWHGVRSNGRILVWCDRADAVRVQSPRIEDGGRQ